MTKMHAEAAKAKVVLIEWNTPESISPDTKEAIGKWCFETSGNDADIAAMPRPCKFPRWNYKWKLSTYPASGGDGSSEPVGESAAPPPSDKALLKKVWPERPWFPLSTSYPEIN